MFGIKLFWTKAHIGVLGNERANCLAKDACYKSNINLYFHLAKLDIKKSLIKLYLLH